MADKDFKTNPLLTGSPSFKPSVPLPSGLEGFKPSNYPTPAQEEKPLTIEQIVAGAAKKPLPKVDQSAFNTGKQTISQDVQKQYQGSLINTSVNWFDDYESLMRQTQSTWDRTKNTAAKFGSAATASFMTGLAVIPNIIGSVANTIGGWAGAEQDVSSTFNLSPDNDFNKSIYQWKDEIEKGSRNYESNWAKDHWIQNLLPVIGDGGFQDIISSSGYTAGAIGEALLTGGIGKVLGIGTRLAGVGAKVAKTLNQVDKVDDVLKGIVETSLVKRGVKNVGASVGFGIGKAISDAPYLYRAYVGAHGEAVFEGLEGQQKLKEDLLNQYKAAKGYAAEGEDYKRIIEIAQEAGEVRYGLNLAMLMVPNYLQMGAILKPFKPLNTALDKLQGNLQVGKVVYDEKDKLAKVINPGRVEFTTTKPFWNEGAGKRMKSIAENTLTTLQKFPKVPLAFSEGLEEDYQLLADEFTNHLYTGIYQNKKDSKDFKDFTGAATHAVSSLFSKEGAKTFLMGAAGGGLQQSVNTIYEATTGNKKQIEALVAQNQGVANSINALLGQQHLGVAMQNYAKGINTNSIRGTAQQKVNNAVRATQLQGVANQAAAKNDQFTFQNVKQQQLFDLLNDVLKTDGGTGNAVEVFNQHLDNIAQTPAEKVKEFYQIQDDINPQEFAASVRQKLQELKRIKSRIDFQYPSLIPNDENGELINNYENYKSELAHKLWTVDRLIERKTDLLAGLSTAYEFYNKAAQLSSFKQSIADNISKLSANARTKANALATPGLPKESIENLKKEKEQYEAKIEKQKELSEKLQKFDGKNKSSDNYSDYLDLVRTAFRINHPELSEFPQFSNVEDNLQKAYDINKLDDAVSNIKAIYEALDRKEGFQEYVTKTTQYQEAIKEDTQLFNDILMKAQPALYKVLSIIPAMKTIIDGGLAEMAKEPDATKQETIKKELHDKLNAILVTYNKDYGVGPLSTKYKTELITIFDLQAAGSVDAVAAMDELQKKIFVKAAPTPPPTPPVDPLADYYKKLEANGKYILGLPTGDENWIITKIEGETVTMNQADDFTVEKTESRANLANLMKAGILSKVDKFPVKPKAPVPPTPPPPPPVPVLTELEKKIQELEKQRNEELVAARPKALALDNLGNLIEAPSGAQGPIDFVGAFTGGILQTYQQVYDALVDGTMKIAGQPSSEAYKLKALFDKGLLKSKIDVYHRLNEPAINEKYDKLIDALKVPKPPPPATPVQRFQLENLINNGYRYVAVAGENIPFNSQLNQSYIREQKRLRDAILKANKGIPAYTIVPVQYANTGKQFYNIDGKGVVFVNKDYDGYELKVDGAVLYAEDGWNTLLTSSGFAGVLLNYVDITSAKVGKDKYSFFTLYKLMKDSGQSEAFVKLLRDSGFYITDNGNDFSKELDFLNHKLDRLEKLQAGAPLPVKRLVTKFGSTESKGDKAKVKIEQMDATETGYVPYSITMPDGRQIETEVYVLIEGFDIQEFKEKNLTKLSQYVKNIDKLVPYFSEELDRKDRIWITQQIQQQLKNKLKQSPEFLAQMSGGFLKVFNDSNGYIYTLNSAYKPLTEEQFIDMIPQLIEALENGDSKSIPFYATFNFNGEQYRTFPQAVIENDKHFLRLVIQRSEASEGQEETVTNLRTKYLVENSAIGIKELLNVPADKLEDRWKAAIVKVLTTKGKARKDENGEDISWKPLEGITKKDIIFATRIEKEPASFQEINDNRKLEIPVYRLSTTFADPIPFEFAVDTFEFTGNTPLPVPVVDKVGKVSKGVAAQQPKAPVAPVVPTPPIVPDVLSFDTAGFVQSKLAKIITLLKDPKNLSEAGLTIPLAKQTDFIQWLGSQTININGVDYVAADAMQKVSDKTLQVEDEYESPMDVLSTVLGNAANKQYIKSNFTEIASLEEQKRNLKSC